MAEFDIIKAAIDANINTNGKQAISGAILNDILKQIIDAINNQKVSRGFLDGHQYAMADGVVSDLKYAMPDVADGSQDDIILTQNSAIYIPDFSVVDILNAYRDKYNIQVQTMPLFDAVEKGKTIYVKEDADYPGKNVCSCYIEDLLYMRILTADYLINLEIPSMFDEELRCENIHILPLYSEWRTPSGDPMHYMYEAAGATYNATNEDIPMEGIYGDSYGHRAGYWHFNELGDITNEEMRKIYLYSYNSTSVAGLQNYWQGNTFIRTNLSFARANIGAHSEQYTFMDSTCETIAHLNTAAQYGILLTNISSFARDCRKLKKVLNLISYQYINSANNADRPFTGCKALEEVRIKMLKYSISFADSAKLSNASILYMIENEAATELITITLHPEALARAEADSAIQAALTEHPYIQLGLAE